MMTFILSTILFALVIAGMSVGVIFQNKPIKGSCGGLNNIGLGGSCDVCGGDTTKCEEEGEGDGIITSGAALAYDATKK